MRDFLEDDEERCTKTLSFSLQLAAFAGGAAALPQAWVTDPSGSQRLAPLAVTWASEAPGGYRVELGPRPDKPDPLTPPLAGFGCSITESAAHMVMTLPEAEREALWDELFTPGKGLGLGVLRQPMGASDFALSVHSYDDLPEGLTDFSLEKFSIDRDREAVLPLLRQALTRRPDLKVLASPWSPPAWMKTGGSMLGASGGVLRDDCYEVYARYFAKFLAAYRDEGVPVFAVTPQNEPQYGPPQYPGMVWPARDAARFIRDHLGPTLAREAPRTKILGWDHNYDGAWYARELLADPATARWLAGTAWHDYGGDAGEMGQVAGEHPDKEIWMTEGGLGTWQGSFTGRFKTGLLEGIAALSNGARSYVLWNLALSASGGPIVFANTANEGLVTVGPKRLVRNASYYVLAHFSRFIAEGARRWPLVNEDGRAVAFANPDGSVAVVLGNPYLSSKTTRVILDTRAVDVEVPAEGAITVVFSPSEIPLAKKKE